MTREATYKSTTLVSLMPLLVLAVHGYVRMQNLQLSSHNCIDCLCCQAPALAEACNVGETGRTLRLLLGADQ